MIEKIIANLPDDMKVEAGNYLSKLVDLENLDKEGFIGLLKSNKTLSSLFDAERDRKNEDYRKKVETELIPARLEEEKRRLEYGNIIASADPDKIKAMIEVEKDPTEKRILQAELKQALVAKEMEGFKKEAEAKKILEKRIELTRTLKSKIDENKYPFDAEFFADLGDKAETVLDKLGSMWIAKETELLEKYKGSGNTEPLAGVVTAELSIDEATRLYRAKKK